jgi:type IV secretory pathway VirB10-like protein
LTGSAGDAAALMRLRAKAQDRVAAPASPNMLQAGAVISAALITGIRSDLPGQITAQVTENIYDSPTGRIPLVPQGTRIIGQYDNNVQFGQSRVLLVWNRLIFPNGRSIVLERQPGADTEGYAGLQDGVDYHWWELAKAAGLSTLLSIGAELATNDDNRLIQAIRIGGQNTINDAGQQIVRPPIECRADSYDPSRLSRARYRHPRLGSRTLRRLNDAEAEARSSRRRQGSEGIAGVAQAAGSWS